ncbi:MAG TPA: hypothetical protein VNW71_11720 [Thermoanaerobaculia bacterium]|nr:hypothetical protein [Thermoanaerobaculia bacterium]
MRRSAGYWLAILLLAAPTGGFAAQDPEYFQVEPEEPSASSPEEDAVEQDMEPAPVEPDGGEDIFDAAPDWQSELDLITDLLIDGKPLEARGKADNLLETENLPENVASRARALRDKADARLAELLPIDAVERPKIEIPSEEKSGEKSEKTVAAAKVQSFKVRVAVIGSGFSEGVTGLLRISEKGLSFVPQGKSREDWAIRWHGLAEAKSDTGLWDAPYPLVLIERSGRKHYLVRLDRKGSYLPGAPLLSAIEKGRRR